jgi:hypothetical protein
LFSKQKTYSYTCGCCGENFSGSPSFGMSRPPFVFNVPEAEYEARVQLDDDLCLVRAGGNQDADLYAIRVTLDIPIHDMEEPFNWGVWVTQSEDSFFKHVGSYGADQSGEISFGWLPVTMPPYQRNRLGDPIESLACDVLWQSKGQRPVIVLHESDHPLYLDQRDGISWDRAVEIARNQMERLHKPH